MHAPPSHHNLYAHTRTHTHTHTHIPQQRARARNVHPFSLSSWSANVDVKLIFVPLIFLLLRVWSAIIDVVYLFLTDDEAKWLLHSEITAAFVLLAVS